MNMLSVAVARSVMALVVASAVIGIPVPASAAGEKGGQLTVDGRPLFGPVSLTTGTREGPMDPLLARSPSASPLGGVLEPGRVDGRVTRAVLLRRSQPAAATSRSWVKRHPVFFGTSLAPLRVPGSSTRESVRRQLSSGFTAARPPEAWSGGS